MNGKLPYVDFLVEYPPLTYLFYLLPVLFFRTAVSYFVALVFELMLFDILAVWMLFKVSARLGISITRSLVVHAVLLVAVGPIIVASFDIIPAVLALVSVYFFIEGRNNWAWAFAVLGFMTKIFPIVLAPLFVLFLWRQKKYRQIFIGAAIFAGIALALSLPWLIINSRGYEIVAIYEIDRPLHSESVYGTILLLAKILGIAKVGGIYNYGSWNLTSSAAGIMAQVSFYITIALLLFTFYLYWRRSGHAKEQTSLIQFSIASVLILMVSGKVLSMQYPVWLVPLIPLFRGRWQLPAVAALAVSGILGQFVYPYNYSLFEAFSPPVIILLLFRNLLLVACAVMVLIPANRKLVTNN